MIRSLHVLALALLMLSGVEFMRRELDALLALAIALGIFHLTELQIDWRARKSVRDWLSERHRVTWVGRFAGWLSSLFLVVYFSASLSGAKL